MSNALTTTKQPYLENQPYPIYKYSQATVQCHAHSRKCAVCGLRPRYENPETGEITPGCECGDKRELARCTQPARPGFVVCRYHGAGKMSGPSGGAPKERYDSDRPELASLMQRYQAALDDPMLFSVRNEFGLLVARNDELKDLLAEGGVMPASDAWKLLKDAIVAIENGAVESGLELALETINAVERDSEIWDEIRTNMAEQRKLADAERKREAELQQMITIARLGLILDQLADRWSQVVYELVEDEDLRRRLLSAQAAESRGILSSILRG